MNLSKDFTLSEMLESQTARRNNIMQQFIPTPKIIANLRLLCDNILQPLRDAVGTSINISSGYRCKELNTRIGGADTSQHVQGQAADIQGADNALLFNKIIELKLPFDQLIWEYGTKKNPAWVHVSFGNRNRRQIIFVPSTLRH